MNISKKDYLLLTAMVEFHFKFAEYVREQDKELFYRAIDYGKTYTEVEGMQFDYWHEDNKKFLDELSRTLIKRKTSFERFAEHFEDEYEAEQQWINKKKTDKEDPLGMKKYLENFIRHARELDYDSFDLTDWVNFANICKHIQEDSKFIEFAKAQVIRVLGSESDVLKEFK